MRASTLLLASLLLSAATAATAQSIVVEKPSCLPREANGLVKATLTSAAPGLAPRLYFRWFDHEDFYWVPLEMEPGGHYWATPPKPELRNERVEIYGALVDAAGKTVTSSESQVVPVTRDCCVQLSPQERGVAATLT